MTFTRLTLGEPRLRGKAHGGPIEEPCVESYVAGEILEDLGAENQTTGGVSGNELPSIEGAFVLGGEPYTYNDGSVADPTEYVHTDIIGGGDFAVISTANPRSGAEHVRLPSGFAGALLPGAQQVCVPKSGNDLINTWANFYTARAEVGDLVDASGYAAEEFATGSSSMRVGAQFFNASYAEVSNTWTDTSVPGTSYVEVTHSATAPSGTVYVVVYFDPTISGAAENIDMDDFSITVS